MPSSLVPEKPLLVYPSLAATLGLEEALLLCTLVDKVEMLQPELSRDFAWYEIDVAVLQAQFPFWSTHDIQRVSTNLREKGVMIISSGALETQQRFRFAFNEKVHRSLANQAGANGQAQASSPTREPRTPPPIETRGGYFLSKNFISPSWSPDEDTLNQLAQHAIPRTFALKHLPEFITYWRERKEQHHSWGAKFHQHVLRKWRDFEAQQNQKQQETQMDDHWKPSADAMEILVSKGGIRREFVEDAIPEFVLYWRERGDSLRTWNTKFVQHVNIQWAKYTASIEHNTHPRPLPEDWRPSQSVYDVLRFAKIDIAFAQSLIPEFVLYWRDRGTLNGSWNTKYLQHVKRQWSVRHQTSPVSGQHAAAKNRQTREISLEEKLTDRSWAN